MKTIKLKKFGKYLAGRDNGKHAYDFFMKEIDEMTEDEKIFCDFQDVLLLAPSYCDELFGEIQENLSDKIVIDENINSALKKSFDVVGEVRKLEFVYGKSDEKL